MCKYIYTDAYIFAEKTCTQILANTHAEKHSHMCTYNKERFEHAHVDVFTQIHAHLSISLAIDMH